MQPVATFDSAGHAGAQTVRGGGYQGPLTCNETGDPYLWLDQDVQVDDMVIDNQAGANPGQPHGILLSIDDPNKTVAVVYSSTCQLGSANRSSVPNVFPKGHRLYVRDAQLAGAGADAIRIFITWRRAGGPKTSTRS